jgi:hypothetical protein
MIEMELNMAENMNEVNSILIQNLAVSEFRRSSAISVKEAARRLGVSVSTVYRADRMGGPIRFLSATRPIMIDLGSFETHLDNISSIENKPELATAGVPDARSNEEQTNCRRNEAVGEATQPSVSRSLEIPSSSCGQRELGPPPRDGISFISYLAYN